MKAFLSTVAVVIVFGLVGNMDYQDELKEQDRYHTMVCEGSWPNYKALEIDCDGY